MGKSSSRRKGGGSGGRRRGRATLGQPSERSPQRRRRGAMKKGAPSSRAPARKKGPTGTGKRKAGQASKRASSLRK